MHVINSLQLVATQTTTEQILAQGFECLPALSLQNLSSTKPQQFSFHPFADLYHASDLKKIWTNWIETKELANEPHQQQLTIEFESEETPALSSIRAMVRWLEDKQLPFQICYKYRRENSRWQGEYCARSRH